MNRFLFLLLSAVASLLPLASACTPTNTSTNSQFIIGTDGPADPATLGYTLNHVALQVQNITATRAFYGEVLGFRHVFTFVESDNYTITYMGYPSGGKNGTGYQTGEEMLREQRNTEGLIEFIWPLATWHALFQTARGPQLVRPELIVVKDAPEVDSRTNGFGHLGLVVPDILALQARLDDYSVPILKRVGQNATQDLGIYYGIRAQVSTLSPSLNALFRGFVLATDPDGYLLEIQEQT
ncbi:hypothetical protein H2199_007611 [Coniosporium tulheliwenetii]|uniref:Uncharacterized protein n=1 Tax=Coniosporium tulheliwenetii TaxID=3383036 RepID=A0ACC2YPU4_9PEZI|nr:hypothetical protein H2199_007611 [Cladosporium sp. JES 115]